MHLIPREVYIQSLYNPLLLAAKGRTVTNKVSLLVDKLTIANFGNLTQRVFRGESHSY